MMQVYLLQSGDMFPIQLSLPPTSIRPFNQYMSRLRTNGLLPSKVLTNISLKKEESNGTPYAVAVFRADRFESEFAKRTTQYAREFKQRMLGNHTSGVSDANEAANGTRSAGSRGNHSHNEAVDMDKSRTPGDAAPSKIDTGGEGCPF